MAEDLTPIGYYEAVVRVPLYPDDSIGPDGPGNWWQYHQPTTTPEGSTGVFQRHVTEVSHRLLDARGNPITDWPPARR